MAFYELVFIARQDVSFTEVDKIINDFISLAQELNGTVVKHEYWGLRSLEYEIKNNKKGHYVLFRLDIDHTGLNEINRKMKFREEIIRFKTIRVKEFDKSPSPILKKSSDTEEIVDVTTK